MPRECDPGDADAMPVPGDLRPVPAAPLLGEEAAFDAVDDEESEYVPDVAAVPGRLDGPRFTPEGIEDFAPPGAMAKLDANLAVLRTLRTLREEGVMCALDGRSSLDEVLRVTHSEDESMTAPPVEQSKVTEVAA